jgi:hypothetical protein
MTQKEAKELSLEVWRYLRDHPEIKRKNGLPAYLWDQIIGLHGCCPLCHVLCCTICPLDFCNTRSRVFWIWEVAKTKKKRQEAAAEIVRRIEAWEPEVEK